MVFEAADGALGLVRFAKRCEQARDGVVKGEVAGEFGEESARM